MEAAWYGAPAPSRAPIVVAAESASREKNHRPSRPDEVVTYVRRFVSGNVDSPGSAGMSDARKPTTRNGVSPTQACPSNVSTARQGGSMAAMGSGRRLHG